MGRPNLDIHAPSAARPFDDRLLMAIGVLGFGISIPLLSGLYGALGPASSRFWLGFAWFIALAAAIWLGNRWLLFKQRQHFDWFSDPWRKLVMLVSANVLFTAPLTALALWAWYLIAQASVDWRTIEIVTLTNVICVVFVTHAYETVFLIRERESDLMRVERLERLRAQAELDGLKAQIDPHFLFNSLNTLGHLIVRDTAAARAFCDTLAEVYRYVLACRERDTVPLAEELEMLRAYHHLLVLRFGNGVVLQIDREVAQAAQRRVPPLALQTLLENAVKHNQVGEAQPLVVHMRLADDPAAPGIEVINEVLARRSVRASSGVGLRNLDERCRWLSGQGLVVDRSGGRFRVVVPWVNA